MKNYLIFAAIIASLPVTGYAYQITLPKHSMVCGTLDSMKEAERAAAANDQKWFDSLTDCLITNQPIQAARVDCESRFCKIRIWMNGQSSLAYTFRSSMSPK